MFKGLSCSLRWLWVSVIVILFDQFSKYWISTHFSLHNYKSLTSWLGITLLHNTGAAFSFLSQANGWQRWVFVVIAVLVSLVLLMWIKRAPSSAIVKPMAAALILGGALGNLIDRMIHGYVIDFVLVHYKNWYFPAFNLADAAITIGAALLIIKAIFSKN